MTMKRAINVQATWDPEAGVWTTESPDVHGLRIEAETLEALVARIPGALQDLFEGGDGGEISVDLTAHARTKVRLAAA